MNELSPDTLKQRLDPAERKSQWWRIGGAITGIILRCVVGFVGAWSLFTLTPISALALSTSCIAFKDSLSLSCPPLGLELWEEGKRSERIFQQWDLKCDSTDQPRAASCQLERTLVVIWPESAGGARVSVHRHSTTDGTFRLLDPNWNKGRLEFEIVYPGGQRMPVLMRFKRRSPDSELLNIESFQAKDVVRIVFADRLVSQEWRIPDYTYSLKLEMVITGKKSADQKAYDEMVKRLAPRDRAIFEQSKKRCVDLAFSEDFLMKEPGVTQLSSRYKARLREIEKKIERAKDEEKWDLFAQQDALNEKVFKEIYGRNDVRNAILAKIDKCLAEVGMSPSGRRAVGEGLLTPIFRAFAEGR